MGSGDEKGAIKAMYRKRQCKRGRGPDCGPSCKGPRNECDIGRRVSRPRVLGGVGRRSEGSRQGERRCGRSSLSGEGKLGNTRFDTREGMRKSEEERTTQR